jgi:NADPH:quinone reductase-like Zn-dependent oxidoreductase
VHAIVIHETGGPDVLRWEELPDPQLADGHMLIRVRAASVNPVDWKIRAGMVPTQLPRILGYDVAGIVESSLADGFHEGDEVFGHPVSGGYAELATAAPDAIVRKPAGLSFEHAAALPVAGLTAWQALFDHGGLESGQTVLIAGAAGGVGHLAVQFAKHAGARVIGIGSSRNREFVLELGADDYVDYTQQRPTDVVRDADLAFDAVGGDTSATLIPALRQRGVLVAIAGQPSQEAAADRGVHIDMFRQTPSRDQLTKIGELAARGELKVELSQVTALREAARAQELSESGHARGKIVMTVAA